MKIEFKSPDKILKEFNLEPGQIIRHTDMNDSDLYIVCRKYDADDLDVFLVSLTTGISYAEFERETNGAIYEVLNMTTLTIFE